MEVLQGETLMSFHQLQQADTWAHETRGVLRAVHRNSGLWDVYNRCVMCKAQDV